MIVDVNKKSKIVSEVLFPLMQENFYEKIRLVGQGTFGKVYLVFLKGRRREAGKMVESGLSKRSSKIKDIKIAS